MDVERSPLIQATVPTARCRWNHVGVKSLKFWASTMFSGSRRPKAMATWGTCADVTSAMAEFDSATHGMRCAAVVLS